MSSFKSVLRNFVIGSLLGDDLLQTPRWNRSPFCKLHDVCVVILSENIWKEVYHFLGWPNTLLLETFRLNGSFVE